MPHKSHLHGSSGLRVILASVLFLGIYGILPATEAETARNQVTVSTGTEMLLGTARELAYIPIPNSSPYLLSELDWPMLPLVYFTGQVSLKTKLGFAADLGLHQALGLASGTQSDSDWANGDGIKTHYSESPSTLDGSTMLDLNVGWSFALSKTASLEPFLSFSVMQFLWHATGGWAQYPPETNYPYTPWSSDEPKQSFYGTVGSYSQLYYYPAFGLNLDFSVSDSVSMRIYSRMSPFVFCDAQDNHYLRGVEFMDTLTGGLLIEPGFETTIAFSPRVSLSILLNYKSITGLMGDETELQTSAEIDHTLYDLPYQGATAAFRDAAGAEFRAFGAAVTLNFSF